MVAAHRKMTEQEKVLEIFWIFGNILNCREVIEIKCRHLIASFPTAKETRRLFWRFFRGKSYCRPMVGASVLYLCSCICICVFEGWCLNVGQRDRVFGLPDPDCQVRIFFRATQDEC